MVAIIEVGVYKLMKKDSVAIFDEDTKYAKILKNICKKNKIKKLTIENQMAI